MLMSNYKILAFVRPHILSNSLPDANATSGITFPLLCLVAGFNDVCVCTYAYVSLHLMTIFLSQLLMYSCGGTRKFLVACLVLPLQYGCFLNWLSTTCLLLCVTSWYLLWQSFSCGPMHPPLSRSKLFYIFPLHFPNFCLSDLSFSCLLTSFVYIHS